MKISFRRGVTEEDVSALFFAIAFALFMGLFLSAFYISGRENANKHSLAGVKQAEKSTPHEDIDHNGSLNVTDQKTKLP